MKYYLPSVTSATETYLKLTRFLLDHMFPIYNTGKQHFLSFTFSKIMFSLTAFLKKEQKQNTAILNSQYFVTSDQSTPWQNNLPFSFLEPLT